MYASLCRSSCALIAMAAMLTLGGGSLRAQAAPPVGPQQTRPDPDFDLGMQKFKDKAYDEAYDAFRRSYRADPTSLRSILGMANTLMAQDRREEAIGLMQVEVRKNPANGELAIAFANLLVRSGLYDHALVELNRIVKAVDPGSRVAAEIYLQMGQAYRGKGDRKSAITALSRARDLAPDNPTTLVALALTWDNLGNKDQAIRMYREALQIDKENGLALNNLAYALLETGGDADQAIKLASRASELMPNSVEVKDTLGWAYLKKNNTALAIETLRPLVLAPSPRMLLFRDHLAMALEQKGDTTPAATELKTLLRGKPSPESDARIKELLQTVGK